MSASKFCRNFLTFPQGASENSCRATGEKQSQNNDLKIQETRDFHSAARGNTEEQNRLDVPLVLVYFPESRKNHLNYRLRKSTVHKKTQNIIISQHRLSTALQKGDSADRDKRLNLNVGHRCNVEEKDTNCSCDETFRRVLRSNDHATSSSFCSSVESMVILKLPPSCSTTAQTLLSSQNSETDEEVPAPSSRQANNIRVTSSSGFRHVKSIVSSKVPPGSTLVSDRGVYRIKDKEKLFACGFCGKTYKIKRSVFSHIRYQHDEKRYCCEFCGRSYGQQCFLLDHMRMHTKEKPFTCDQCGKRFGWQGGLRRHRFTHTKVRPFICRICNKSYKSNGDLLNHNKVHNIEECWVSKCNICKKKFPYQCTLKQHMLVHTGEKPFKCSLCDEQFRLKMQLQSHLNTHSGQRKTCSVCGKSVAATSMFVHMKTHRPSGDKRFECNICGKRFPRKPNLEGHMRSHTGEKPFACGGCDK